MRALESSCRLVNGLGLGLLLVASALPASAATSPLSVGGELGAGTMLPQFQRDQLDYGLAVQGSLRVGLRVTEPLVLQLAVRNWWFPSDSGYGRASLLGGGLRLEPMVGSVGRFFVDGNVGIGLTGDFTRFTFDAGVGFELAIGEALGLGPAVRYGQLMTSSSDVPTDAKYWSAGLSLTVRFPEPAPPPPPPVVVAPPPPPPRPADSDGDGIPDGEDVCPQQPAGAHPDPDKLRRGCPLKDTDADGVFDNDDRCPTTPVGPNPDPERSGCPDGDDDNDGVLNHGDKCPAQHQGMFPDPERPGCPAPDRDNDSVPDATDACPDKPGAPHPDPKKNGCPGLVKVEGGQIRILKPVFFATNKDTILAKSFPVLQAMADALKATPAIKKISVEGHTDGQGKPDYNMELSRRRAESVKQFLVKNGIAEDRLETKGFGDSKPLGSNKTGEGRSVNRRVEFVIVDPPQNTAPAEPPAPEGKPSTTIPENTPPTTPAPEAKP